MPVITKTVEVEVDLEDLLLGMSDSELAEIDLVRVIDGVSQQHEALFFAAERGDCAAVIKAAEQLAWEMYGRILTGKVAA